MKFNFRGIFQQLQTKNNWDIFDLEQRSYICPRIFR